MHSPNQSSRWTSPQLSKLSTHFAPSPPGPSLPRLSDYTVLPHQPVGFLQEAAVRSCFSIFVSPVSRREQKRNTRFVEWMGELTHFKKLTHWWKSCNLSAAGSLEIPHLHKEPCNSQSLDRRKPTISLNRRWGWGGKRGTGGSGREKEVGAALPHCSLKNVESPLQVFEPQI